MAEATAGTGRGGALSNLAGKRVLLLFPHVVTPGGALNYTLRLAEQLRDEGAAVAILTLRADPAAFDLPGGVEVIALDGPLTSSLGYWLLLPFWQARIGRSVAAWHPDVLVPQVFPANWWGWLYKRSHREMKLVWVCHEPSAFIHSAAWIRALRPWWKSLLARSLRPALSRIDVALARYCDRTLANSCFTAAEMERVYGFAADGIARPGIDFRTLSATARPKERLLITVARLTRFKRIDFLLEVFAEVLKVHPDLTWLIVGSGEDEALLRRQAARLGLGERVVFCGAVGAGELADLYRRATLFLHGSVGEPFGMAPLEAIACGTPVVAHNSGGPKEFVTAACGRLVDSLECADWAREIAACLDDLAAAPDFQARVRECARPYDWHATLRPALEVIAELCRNKGKAPEAVVKKRFCLLNSNNDRRDH